MGLILKEVWGENRGGERDSILGIGSVKEVFG